MEFNSAKDRVIIWSQVKSLQLAILLFAITYAVQITLISEVTNKIALFVEEVTFIRHLFSTVVLYVLIKIVGVRHKRPDLKEALPHLLCFSGLWLCQSYIWMGSFGKSLFADHMADWFSIVLGLALYHVPCFIPSGPNLLTNSRTKSKLIVLISALGLFLVWYNKIIFKRVYRNAKLVMLGYGSDVFLTIYVLLLRKQHLNTSNPDGSPNIHVMSHALALSSSLVLSLGIHLVYKWIPNMNDEFSIVSRLMQIDSWGMVQLIIGNVAGCFNFLIIVWLMLNTQYETWLQMYAIQQAIVWMLFAMNNRWMTWGITNAIGLAIVAVCSCLYLREQLQSRKVKTQSKILPL